VSDELLFKCEGSTTEHNVCRMSPTSGMKSDLARELSSLLYYDNVKSQCVQTTTILRSLSRNHQHNVQQLQFNLGNSPAQSASSLSSSPRAPNRSQT